jgi:hypothetical protein
MNNKHLKDIISHEISDNIPSSNHSININHNNNKGTNKVNVSPTHLGIHTTNNEISSNKDNNIRS